MPETTYKIICTLPHAATEINGISFIEEGGELVAEDIAEREALHFKKIPGYDVVLTGEDDDSHEGDHNSVLSAIKSMSVKEVNEFLKVEPAAWNHVLTVEEKRSDPRQGVMDAVKSAKESLSTGT